MKRLITITLLSCLTSVTKAQDYHWWANNVQWDGVTYWKKYIIYSPYYLGPNALAVPSVPNGKIDSIHSIAVSGNVHAMAGDFTANVAVYGTYVLVKDIISFDAYYIPYEYFNQSHGLKTERRVFYIFYNSNSARGDLIVNTKISLLKKLQPRLHLMLRFGYRFATSKNYAAARYTDAPGYTIDVNGSMPLGKKKKLLVKAMLGAYIWQVNEDSFDQNDAFLFGSGAEYHHKNYTLDFSIAGYLGYLKERRDKPIVIRAGYEKKLKRSSLFFKFQQGLHDFRYSSVELGYRYNFKVKSNSL